MKKEDQLYKIRTAAHNEQTIHAPAELSGWYKLSVDANGDFRYKKVFP
jgi:uncharacterized protein YegP (UPF0339 family)